MLLFRSAYSHGAAGPDLSVRIGSRLRLEPTGTVTLYVKTGMVAPAQPVASTETRFKTPKQGSPPNCWLSTTTLQLCLPTHAASKTDSTCLVQFQSVKGEELPLVHVPFGVPYTA